MVARGDNFIENAGNNHPTMIPKNNAPNINVVNLEVFTIIPRKIIILQKGDFCFHLDINLTFLFHKNNSLQLFKKVIYVFYKSFSHY
jgi:hypothetical protein